jgi:hypothetical protein
MSKTHPHSPGEAETALADLREGFDSARRLVEQARFLLAGSPPQPGDALVSDPEQANEKEADQAAAAPASETVQKPSGE